MERVNISILNQIEKGRKIIKDAGGVKAYDRMIRSQEEFKKPKMNIEHKPQIIFED